MQIVVVKCFGAGISFAVFRTPLTPLFVLAAGIMVVGAYFAATGGHVHVHVHESVKHDHRHGHDDGHHTHVHDPPVEGEHSHEHLHERLEHDHPHGADMHHVHVHEEKK